jgi:CRISPR-associated protein Cas2
MTSYYISYDISQDRLRDKLAKLLQQKGCRRVQKSVFFVPGFSAKELKDLKYSVSQCIGGHLAAQDSVLCIPVTRSRLADLVWEGQSAGLQRSLNDDLHLLI